MCIFVIFIVLRSASFSSQDSADTTSNKNKTVQKEEKFGEEYGNPVIHVHGNKATLLDGTDVLNLTCNMNKKYHRFVKQIDLIGWQRKSPEGGDYSHVYTVVDGKFIWDKDLEKTWKKYHTMKRHFVGFGDNKRVATSFLTLLIPLLPCEDNGIFQCVVWSITLKGEYKQWYTKYRFNDSAICNATTTPPSTDMVVPVLKRVTGSLAIGLCVSLLCILTVWYWKNKRTPTKKRRRKGKKRSRKRSPRRKHRSSKSRHRSSDKSRKRAPPPPPPPSLGKTPPPPPPLSGGVPPPPPSPTSPTVGNIIPPPLQLGNRPPSPTPPTAGNTMPPPPPLAVGPPPMGVGLPSSPSLGAPVFSAPSNNGPGVIPSLNRFPLSAPLDHAAALRMAVMNRGANNSVQAPGPQPRFGGNLARRTSSATL